MLSRSDLVFLFAKVKTKRLDIQDLNAKFHLLWILILFFVCQKCLKCAIELKKFYKFKFLQNK
jgi:membrane-bound acyltransferase YfiQ involved in biofilm formation